MRPTPAADQIGTRSRKSSTTEPSLSSDRQSAAPTTFFLSRGPDTPRATSDQHEPFSRPIDSVSTLQDTLNETSRRPKQATPRILDGQQRPSSRRRSTIKPALPEHTRRRTSSTVSQESVQQPDRASTPSPLLSHNVSLPSSPKSASSRSVHRSDEDSISDDAVSQAVASSEDDEDNQPAEVQDSQPELIMPSIKMPSRRPFTARGKRLGRFKILVAGQKGNITACIGCVC